MDFNGSKKYFRSSLLFFLLIGGLITCESDDDLINCAPGDLLKMAESNEFIILTNGIIIDGTGKPPICNKSLIIHENKIADIVEDCFVEFYPEATLIDLHQSFILPGFINAHVHNDLNTANLRTWVKAGVTTVRDLGYSGTSPGYFSKLDELNGINTHARILGAGPLITTPGGYGMLGVSSVADAEQKVESLIDRGADIIKVAIEDALQGRSWPMISDPILNQIVKQAHENDLWVSAHVSRERHVRKAIDCGADDLAHMAVDNLSDEIIRELVDEDMYWVPTLELWKGCDELHNIEWCPIAINNLRRFFEQGGKVALGTDVGGYVTPFDTGMPITEMTLMQEAGMSNMEIIQAATLNAAKVCDMENDLGTIEKGKIADILVIYRDPLIDLNHLLDVRMVLHNGEIIVNNGRDSNKEPANRYCPPSFAPFRIDK